MWQNVIELFDRKHSKKEKKKKEKKKNSENNENNENKKRRNCWRKCIVWFKIFEFSYSEFDVNTKNFLNDKRREKRHSEFEFENVFFCQIFSRFQFICWKKDSFRFFEKNIFASTKI